jgi:cysteinyl-tRNA synthetase
MRFRAALATVALLLTASAAGAAPWDIPPLAAFHYQLQNLDVAAASTSPFPLLVTDYSFDGSAAGELSPAQVTSLESGGRRVLAYMSIGEAETYRFYWDPTWNDQGANDPDRPAWLGPVNRSFPDNLKVRFWDPAWQAIIFGAPGAYLDRIIAQGFDGVYLDIVDAYEFWGPDGNDERPSAAADMIDFVEQIAAYARATHPSFAVVPQNAEALLADPTYLATISAHGAEDTWFRGNATQSHFQAEAVVPMLDAVVAAGKAVLAIDYPTNVRRIADFFDRAEAKGYGAYNSTRALDLMTIHTAHPPSPGPGVTLDTPAPGATASATVPPTFSWSTSGAVGVELHFAGSTFLRTLKVLPKKRNTVLPGSSYTPALKDWKPIVRLTKKGDGTTLYWWAVAVDASGARRSAPFQTLAVTLP